MKESYWVGDCFSRAWGSGLVRPLLRQYLGARCLHLHLKPKPALGSIAGVVTALDGSTEAVVAEAGG
jgi:hypothetical protein